MKVQLKKLSGKGKKDIKKYDIICKNDCNLVTNIKNNFSNNTILNTYRLRWDIEIFFKYIKYNFKFQNMKEDKVKQYKKMYLCELIITYC